MENFTFGNVHDKVFFCPKCKNKTLYPVYGNEHVLEIGYYALCVCDECAAELRAVPQYNGLVKFIENKEKEEIW